MKTCNRCNLTRPYAEYSPNKNSPDGYKSICRECDAASQKKLYAERTPGYQPRRPDVQAFVRENAEVCEGYGLAAGSFYHYRAAMGLEPQDVIAVLAASNGRCDLCSRSWEAIEGRRRFCIDHCHRTGRIRGVLCYPCNTGLGQLGDTEEVLKRALAYVQGV